MTTSAGSESAVGPDAVEAAISVGLGRKLRGSKLPACLGRILGRSPLQRHLFHLANLGIRRCALVFGAGPDAGAAERECRRQLAELPLGAMSVTFQHAGDGPVPGAAGRPGQVILVCGGAVYDPRLYRSVWESPSPVWVVDRSETGIGLAKLPSKSVAERGLEVDEDGRFAAAVDTGSCGADELLPVQALPTYLPGLRRHLPPYWCTLRTDADLKRAGRLILDSAQKGVLDFPARFLHPAPEDLFTRGLARTRVTPNQITVFTALLAFAATYLLATQSFGWGLAIALLVNVLDGVDGKLARVKLQTSRSGDRLDHILDVTFEFSWYLGLGWGLAQTTGHWLPLHLGAGLIAVMVASRALSGAYRLLTGRQIHDHRSFDRAFRLVAGRRNVYVVILVVGLVAGRLDWAFYAAFGWGVATLFVYIARTLMALAAKSG